MGVGAMETSKGGGMATKVGSCKLWHILVAILIVAIIVVAIAVPVSLTHDSSGGGGHEPNNSDPRVTLSVVFLAADPILPNANQSQVTQYYPLAPIIIYIQSDINVESATDGLLSSIPSSSSTGTSTELRCAPINAGYIKCLPVNAVRPGEYMLSLIVNNQYDIDEHLNIIWRLQDGRGFQAPLTPSQAANATALFNYFSLAVQPISAMVSLYNGYNANNMIHFNATVVCANATEWFMSYGWNYTVDDDADSTTRDDDYQIVVMLAETIASIKVASQSFMTDFNVYLSNSNSNSHSAVAATTDASAATTGTGRRLLQNNNAQVVSYEEVNQQLRSKIYFIDILTTVLYNAAAYCPLTINVTKCERVVFAMGGPDMTFAIESIVSELTAIRLPQYTIDNSSITSVTLTCGLNTNAIPGSSLRLQNFSLIADAAAAQLFPDLTSRLANTWNFFQEAIQAIPSDGVSFFGLQSPVNRATTALFNPPQSQVPSAPWSGGILSTTYCNGTADALICDCSRVPFMSPIQTETILLNTTVPGWTEFPFQASITSTLINNMPYNKTYIYNHDCSADFCCCPISNITTILTYVPALNATTVSFSFESVSQAGNQCGTGDGGFNIPYGSTTVQYQDDTGTNITIDYSNNFHRVSVDSDSVCTFSCDLP